MMSFSTPSCRWQGRNSSIAKNCPMPLSCDCYSGCWGDHSKGCPSIGYTPERAEYCAKKLTHGSYVIIHRGCGERPYSRNDRYYSGDGHTAIRIETEEDAMLVRLGAKPTPR